MGFDRIKLHQRSWWARQNDSVIFDPLISNFMKSQKPKPRTPRRPGTWVPKDQVAPVQPVNGKAVGKQSNKVKTSPRDVKKSNQIVVSLIATAQEKQGEVDALREIVKDQKEALLAAPVVESPTNSGSSLREEKASPPPATNVRNPSLYDGPNGPDQAGLVTMVKEGEEDIQRHFGSFTRKIYQRCGWLGWFIWKTRLVKGVDYMLNKARSVLERLGILSPRVTSRGPLGGSILMSSLPELCAKLSRPGCTLSQYFGDYGLPKKFAPFRDFMRHFISLPSTNGRIHTHTLYCGRRVMISKNDDDVRPVAVSNAQLSKRTGYFTLVRVKATRGVVLRDMIASEEILLDAERLFPDERDPLMQDKLDRRFETVFGRLNAPPYLWASAKTGTTLCARLLSRNVTTTRDEMVSSLLEPKNQMVAVGTILGTAAVLSGVAIGLARLPYRRIQNSSQGLWSVPTLALSIQGVHAKYQLGRLATSLLRLCRTLFTHLLGLMARCIGCAANCLTSTDRWLMSFAASCAGG